jgi:uncharacterized protein DUF4426
MANKGERMSNIPGLLLATALSCFLALPSPARAEQSQDFGPYVVHYNAITTDTLLPEVARVYNITRSKNRAMLTLSVLKKVMNTTGMPVAAAITGSATNLNGQLRTLDMREIREGNAIYFVSEIPVAKRETLDFNLQIIPKGSSSTFTVKFRQEFFND